VDNGSLGAERTSLRNLSLDTDVADVENPDLASVARSLGFESYTASDPASLEDAISGLLSSGLHRRPCLLSLRVDKDAPTPEMDRAFESYRSV
jgi:thiamine pyrophosphate-dependent acetolactate synthase large subunit-like protein